MNKNQFLHTLKQQLDSLGPQQIQEILADFEEHFANGIERGKSEQDLAQELGDPQDIARQYLDSLAEGQSRQDIRTSWQETTYAHVESLPADPATPLGQDSREAVAASPGKIQEGMLVLVIVLNLFIGIPLWSAVLGILLGFWSAAAGIGIASFIVLAVAILEAGMIGLILLLTFLSLLSLSILGIIIMYYLTKLTTLLFKTYIRWNKQLITGGETT